MRQLLALTSTVVLLSAGCQGAQPGRAECTTRVTLTGDEPETWWLTGHTGFRGSASVVVCQPDVQAVVTSRDKLLKELGRVVEEQAYGMLIICHADAPGPKEGEKAKSEARKSYADMVERFNRVLGGTAIKAVECDFGSVETF